VAERMVGKVKNYSTKPYKENSEPRTRDKSFASTMLLETVQRWQKSAFFKILLVAVLTVKMHPWPTFKKNPALGEY